MKPNFKDAFPFSEHLIGMEMGKTEIKMTLNVSSAITSSSIKSVSFPEKIVRHFDHLKQVSVRNYGKNIVITPNPSSLERFRSIVM